MAPVSQDSTSRMATDVNFLQQPLKLPAKVEVGGLPRKGSSETERSESTASAESLEKHQLQRLQEQSIGDDDESNDKHSPLWANTEVRHEEKVSWTEGPRFMEAKTPMMGTPIVLDPVRSGAALAMGEEYSKEAGNENWREVFEAKLLTTFLPEEARLRQMFESITAYSGSSRSILNRRRNESNFILISGPEGSGTCRLAFSLRSSVLEKDGNFIIGKFDRLRRPIPYTAFVTAFAGFTNQVIAKGPEAVEKMREAVLSAVGPSESCVLTSMIPDLERILGTRDGASAVAKAEDAVQRFIFAFRMFIRTISSLDHPVVILLHDLHYADHCSLDLLAQLASDVHATGLVIIGTCDSMVVNPDSYLASKLREIEDFQGSMNNISVMNLNESEINCFLTEMLGFKGSVGNRFAQVVSHQTGGNMFYVVEFLQWLQESNLLVRNQKTDEWSWDEESTRMTISTSSLGDFLVDKLEQLDPQLKDVLKVASCLGFTIDHALIEYVLCFPVLPILERLTEMGILAHNATGHMFLHDGIQIASYRLIPESERELFHLEVGRRLWRKLESEDVDRYLFYFLSQFHLGKRLITRAKEQIAIATLCLHAGKKAAKSSTFRTALVYLDLGIELMQMQPNSWRAEYDLMLALHVSAAEMDLCTANFEGSKGKIQAVLDNGRRVEDKVPAYATKMNALSMQNEQQACLDLGIEVLKHLGETFPFRMCRTRLLAETKVVERLVRGKSDEQILRMPYMTNEAKLQATQLLNFMILPSLTQRPKLGTFVILKFMKLTMQYGLSHLSSFAFGTYGMLVIAALGDVALGTRYGNIGLKLLDQFQSVEYLPRVYASVYGCIHGWSKPFKEALPYLLHARTVGLQTGDIEFASLCSNLYCWQAFDCGLPMDEVLAEWEGFRETMTSTRQEGLLRMALPSVQMIHHLMGMTDDPLSPRGDLMDFDQHEKDMLASGSPQDHNVLQFARMQLGFTFGDMEMAEKYCLSIKDIDLMPPTFERVSVAFFIALIGVDSARRGVTPRQKIKTLMKVIKMFRKWGDDSPRNCMDRLFLLEAELNSYQGKNQAAYRNFLCAIAFACQSDSHSMTGFTNERLARHLIRIDKKAEAKPYFQAAVEAFEKWAGHAKVRRLRREMAVLYGEDTAQ